MTNIFFLFLTPYYIIIKLYFIDDYMKLNTLTFFLNLNSNNYFIIFNRLRNF